MNDLAEYYKVFDSAVAKMSAALRAKADIHRTETQRDGSIFFYDQQGSRFARVDPDGQVTYPQQTAQAPVQKGAPAARPGMTRREQEMLIAVAKKVNGLDNLMAEFVETVAAQIKDLRAATVTKALDCEVVEELGDALSRLENLENTTQALREQLGEKGMRFRGFWRQGKEACKNELFTHNGSCWIALRDTDEAPSDSSPDWTLVARKGRDAKREDAR